MERKRGRERVHTLLYAGVKKYFLNSYFEPFESPSYSQNSQQNKFNKLKISRLPIKGNIIKFT